MRTRGDGLSLSIVAIAIVAAAIALALTTRVPPVTAAIGSAAGDKPAAVQFNRDIRPILSENCFACHGPDHNKRKAGLRLDQHDEAIKTLKSGEVAIVPGDTDHSALISRILSDDPDEHMPPPDSGKKLTPQQIDVLKRWVKQGAPWQPHWSLIAPQVPEPPVVKTAARMNNPIDAFIVSRLEREGLSPSLEADRPTLIRRLTLGLLGLPPTPAEVDAFVNDTSVDAYQRLVDRLLASPHFGERMALEWLDAARFADTQGYHIDSGRDMTPWRDWVIGAFNSNKPFDQFTVEQLAGDLLPNATLEQKIASGFHRNNMINFEGGAIAAEYLNAYLIDRVSTTGTVWLGLTVNCTQCHDHKFDPISQKEFYQLYAFFNSVPENGLDGAKGNAAPLVQIPDANQSARVAQINAKIAAIQKPLDGPQPALDEAQAAWEKSELSRLAEDRVEWTPLKYQEIKSKGGAVLTELEDHSLRASGPNPDTDTYTFLALAAVPQATALQLEALPDDALAANGPGRSGNGNFALTGVNVEAGPLNDPGTLKPVPLASVKADFEQDTFPAALALSNTPAKGGWAVYPQLGKPHAAVFQFAQPVPYIGGSWMKITLSFKSRFKQHTLGRFRLSATAAKDPNRSSKPPSSIIATIAIQPEKRTADQARELRNHYRTYINTTLREQNDSIAKLKSELGDLMAQVPSTMVMAEMPKPRETHILLRGEYDKKGDRVEPGTPACLPPMAAGIPRNRLGLAKWLVDPSHPLTARVIVNRYWQMYFGTGLVKTAEDFGVQGEYPTHPELLDWLACEFVRSGWDVKAMQRLIITSATYRQSSRTSSDLVARDPENRLLAHGPRFRLPAEFVRDQALAVSGLLNEQIGGKSVNPYQPPGLWEELMSRSDGKNWTAQVFVQDHGPDLYRRGMYTFWKRTSPPASLSVLDAPDRQVCVVRRNRTNTPLQALVLMNDPTFVEAARKLAERALTEGGHTSEQRIDFIFKLATARAPKAAELAVLKYMFDQELENYHGNPQAAAKLLAIGESRRNQTLDKAEHAAWTMLCSAILNLDETLTKN